MHTDMLALMNDLLDGTAAPGSRERLQVHMARCAECAAAWSAMSRVHETLSAPAALVPAAGFTARVMDRIAVERKPARQGLQFGWAALVVLALAFAVALVLLLPWPDLDGTAFLVDVLAMLVALAQMAGTWTVLLGTFARTLAALGGETVVSGALAALLLLMAAWIWLVTGAGSLGRRLQDSGGLQ